MFDSIPPHAKSCWADHEFIYIAFSASSGHVISKFPIHSAYKAIEQLKNPLIAKPKREFIPTAKGSSKALEVLKKLRMVPA
jgi:hypothetical protein